MIRVNRLNNEEFWLSADQIEFIEANPDTVISLVSGRKVVVAQSIEDIIEKVVSYRRAIFVNLPSGRRQDDIEAV